MTQLTRLLTGEAIETVTAAVFARPGVQVIEAYSEYDQKLRHFNSQWDLATYAKDKVLIQRQMAFVFVLYPDMGGRAEIKKIQFRTGTVANHKWRYTLGGWGLIAVQLDTGSDRNSASRIVANSEVRARAWEKTQPEWVPVDAWKWSAIHRHIRRLQRVLRRVA